MKKERIIVPIVLFLCSFPFYFLGLFSLKDENGKKLCGSLRLWYIGLTGDYAPYKLYFYTKLANFASAIVGLLIFSLILMIVYIFLTIFKKNLSSEKKYITLSFVFVLLSHCFYLSAIVIEALFYSNKFHACYVILGNGRLGFGVPLGIMLQAIAFWVHYVNFIQYVWNPYRESKKLLNNEDELVKTVATKSQSSINVAQAAHKAPTNNFYLICYRGTYAGGKIELVDNKELRIGKDQNQCAVIIDKKYKSVSRLHCGVIRKGYNFYVKDYSKNGTFMSFDKTRLQTGGILNKVESGQRFNLAKTDNEFYCLIE